MIIEQVTFHVRPGKEEQFLAEARPHGAAMLREHHGCHDVFVGQDTAEPERMLAVVQWEAMDDYRAFSVSEERTGWRGRVDPLFTAPPEIRFFERDETFDRKYK
ncbi:putative quinol monooxygenase [Streptomyces sp. NPDC054796]